MVLGRRGAAVQRAVDLHITRPHNLPSAHVHHDAVSHVECGGEGQTWQIQVTSVDAGARQRKTAKESAATTACVVTKGWCVTKGSCGDQRVVW